MKRNFDSAYDDIAVLTAIVANAANQGGMAHDRKMEIISEIMDHIDALDITDQVRLMSTVCGWADLVWADSLNMKIYNTCCSKSSCSSYRQTLAFLKRHGLESSIGHDDSGHFFEVRLPKDEGRRDRFLKALAKRATKLPPEN